MSWQVSDSWNEKKNHLGTNKKMNKLDNPKRVIKYKKIIRVGHASSFFFSKFFASGIYMLVQRINQWLPVYVTKQKLIRIV